MWPAGQAPQIVVSVSRELHQSELMPFQPGTNETWYLYIYAICGQEEYYFVMISDMFSSKHQSWNIVL